jgi:hypothetical protein
VSYLFQLGQVLTSPGVRATLTKDQLISVLRQHASGDWSGDCRDANEQAVLNGSQVFSTFVLVEKSGQPPVTVWVLTDEDRAKTLVMFPRESAYRASDLEEVPGPLLHGLL